MKELTLFPLAATLVPYGRMPLQIFEQRYLDLVRHSLKHDEPFGVVWIRRGSEVAQRGRAAPDLGDYGTCARIVDWDQLPNGLLGVTIEGAQRFELSDTAVCDNGLLVGQVQVGELPAAAPVQAEWQSLVDVHRSLETHEHVQRMGLQVDHANAWHVGYSLVQLLPLEESLKYELLGLDTIGELMGELDVILNQISGAD
jgi:Lon protease-like protein